jgi:hypothetical protein
MGFGAEEGAREGMTEGRCVGKLDVGLTVGKYLDFVAQTIDNTIISNFGTIILLVSLATSDQRE